MKISQSRISHLLPFTIFVVDVRQHKVNPAPSVSEVDRVFAVLLFVDLQREENAITLLTTINQTQWRPRQQVQLVPEQTRGLMKGKNTSLQTACSAKDCSDPELLRCLCLLCQSNKEETEKI